MGAARIFAGGGAKIEAPSGERRRREVEARRLVGCENFSIFELKKASFGAFLVLFFEVDLNGNWLRPLSGIRNSGLGLQIPICTFPGRGKCPLCPCLAAPVSINH